MEGAKEKEKEDIPGCVSDAGERKKRNRDGCKTKKKGGFVCGGTDIDGSMASGSKKIEKKRTKNTQK